MLCCVPGQRPRQASRDTCHRHTTGLLLLPKTLQMQCHTLTLPRPCRAAISCQPPSRRRAALRVRCDDDDMIPLGKIKKGFTDKELRQLSHPRLLGGKTVGDELGEPPPPSAGERASRIPGLPPGVLSSAGCCCASSRLLRRPVAGYRRPRKRGRARHRAASLAPPCGGS